jgi:hypothetical protein
MMNLESFLQKNIKFHWLELFYIFRRDVCQQTDAVPFHFYIVNISSANARALALPAHFSSSPHIDARTRA